MRLLRYLIILWTITFTFHLAEPAIDFGAREIKGHVTDHSIAETSGLAISRVHQDVAYVHNDKGDSSRFFALDLKTGKKLATFIVHNAQNYDWEDITIGPCIDDCQANSSLCSSIYPPSRYCLYIGDIGDHAGDGAKNIIYMIREPRQLSSTNVDVLKTLEFTWHEIDAETLMISPDGRLFVVSKIKHGHAKMAELPASGWGHKVTLDMTKTATLRISTDKKDPQGGDISSDGKHMLLVCEEAVYYYSVPDGDFLTTVRNQIPTKVASYIVVPATEAISWTPNGLTGLYTIPEGEKPYFYFYPAIQS